ncbi:hypothetical protein B0H19DRAFT_1116088 [Mycena capillaripes]|nr:hypothetical protein B0H19DRAFT_1116088 [Mycena capillaripes]
MDPPPATSSVVAGPSNFTGNDSNWPKRTPKACSNCRRDKVRCDGAKPCNNCLKKSLQCLDGCDPCRRARARCEKTGGDSCIRCDQKELICTEESSAIRTAPLPTTPVSTERVKSACQNCRNDKNKCGNERPCARCVARSEPCIPIPRGSGRAKTRCEGCRKRNIRCDNGAPCGNCVTAGTECVHLTHQGRGCGPRVKAACINCRRNKIRCDGARPCAGCTNRGSECREQLCRRCAQDGLDECTHRALLNQEINEAIQSTSNAEPVLSSSANTLPNHKLTMTYPNLGSPSMFAPPTQQPPYISPPSNSVPVATSPTASTRA